MKNNPMCTTSTYIKLNILKPSTAFDVNVSVPPLHMLLQLLQLLPLFVVSGNTANNFVNSSKFVKPVKP